MLPHDMAIQRRHLQQIMQEESMIPAGTPPFLRGICTQTSSIVPVPSLGTTRMHIPSSYGSLGSDDDDSFNPQVTNRNSSMQTGSRTQWENIKRMLSGPYNNFIGKGRNLGRYLNILPPAQTEVTDFASRVKNAENEQDRGRVGADLAKLLKKFDEKFTLYEMEGDFNIDSDNSSNIARGLDESFFSREYVLEVASNQHFHMLPNCKFISNCAIIDLCRCPVVFVMDDDKLGELVDSMSISVEKANLQPDFHTWLQTIDERNVNSEQQRVESLKLLYAYSFGSLMKRALMRIRSYFTNGLNIESNKSQEVRDHFNMNYTLWVRLLAEKYVINIDPNDKEDMDNLFQLTAPCSTVNMCVAELLNRASYVPPEEAMKLKAQEQDLFYANLVHGSSVRIPLADIWAPNNQLEHTDRDSNKFFDIMWKSLREVLKNSMGDISSSAEAGGGGVSGVPRAQNKAADFVDSLTKSVSRLRDTKKLMRQIWEESNEYRISDRVHMAEIQVLQRLGADGVFPYLNREAPATAAARGNFIQNIHLCFYMRRSYIFRYAFAAAVGKRMFAERLSSGQKNIIEHHRAVHWSETEYYTLMQLVRDNSSLLYNDLNEGLLPDRGWIQNDPTNKKASELSTLFEDYCSILNPVSYVSLGELQSRMEFSAFDGR